MRMIGHKKSHKKKVQIWEEREGGAYGKDWLQMETSEEQ